MKTFKLTAIAAAVSIVMFTPSTALANLTEKAAQSCTEKAQADGFTLNRVVSAEETTGGGAKVVLDLTKVADGTNAKLTCTLSPEGNVVFGDMDAVARLPGINPLLWALLPIIGLPPLLAWARGRRDQAVATAAQGYIGSRINERHEAIVRSNSDTLDVYSGPATTYRVSSTVRNGQRVVLTGRYDNNWAELESGGWIPVDYVEAATRYAR